MKAWSPMKWPLSLQLVVSFALITLVALGGGGVLLAFQVTNSQLAHRSEQGLAQARFAANLVNQYRFSQDPTSLSPTLFTYHEQTGVRPILVDREGKVIADSWIPSPYQGQVLENVEIRQALEGQEVTARYRTAENHWLLYAAVPVRTGQRIDGALLITVSLQDLATSLGEMRRQLEWALALAGLLAVAAGLALARYLSRPLERLLQASSAMGSGQLQTQVSLTGSREVEELGQQFNRMAKELSRLDEQRRNFVAAASHELRTPVASIRALADALLTDSSGEVERYKEYLQDMVGETDRASHLMSRLLELAKLESRVPHGDGHDQAQLEQVDLQELCLDLIDWLQPQAEAKGVALACLVDHSRLIQADRWLLETLMTNLVQNGIKYTPTGGQVSLSLTENDHELQLHVTDTGPGIPPENLPHLFDRFYRVESSRSRSTGGIGLGLAIAAEAARLLHGRIQVTSTPGEGSRFSVVLKP